MRSLILVSPHGLVAAGVIVWAFWPEVRIIRHSSARQRTAAAPRDPSFRWMLLTQNAGMAGALASAYFLPQFGVRDARLVRTLGDSYLAYMRRTWRFVPFLRWSRR